MVSPHLQWTHRLKSSCWDNFVGHCNDPAVLKSQMRASMCSPICDFSTVHYSVTPLVTLCHDSSQ